MSLLEKKRGVERLEHNGGRRLGSFADGALWILVAAESVVGRVGQRISTGLHPHLAADRPMVLPLAVVDAPVGEEDGGAVSEDGRGAG